jgi:hypothetical protein
MTDVSFFAHVPGGNCPHCRALGIDFGEDEPDSDPGSSYAPPAEATITPGHLSEFDPWASRPRPDSEQ